MRSPETFITSPDFRMMCSSIQVSSSGPDRLSIYGAATLERYLPSEWTCPEIGAASHRNTAYSSDMAGQVRSSEVFNSATDALVRIDAQHPGKCVVQRRELVQGPIKLSRVIYELMFQ